MPTPAPARLSRPTRGLPASVQASPSGFVPQPTAVGPSQTITVTSVTGSFLQLTIHVTRDLHPVFYTGSHLPDTGFDLQVEDVTRAQFEALATRTGCTLADVPGGSKSSVADWHSALVGKMVALDTLLAVSIGHSLHCAQRGPQSVLRCYLAPYGSSWSLHMVGPPIDLH